MGTSEGVTGIVFTTGIVLRTAHARRLYPYFKEAAGPFCKSLRRATQRPSVTQSTSLAWHPANDGLLGKFASMLVRPDGFVATCAVDDAGSIEFAADCRPCTRTIILFSHQSCLTLLIVENGHSCPGSRHNTDATPDSRSQAGRFFRDDVSSRRRAARTDPDAAHVQMRVGSSRFPN